MPGDRLPPSELSPRLAHDHLEVLLPPGARAAELRGAVVGMGVLFSTMGVGLSGILFASGEPGMAAVVLGVFGLAWMPYASLTAWRQAPLRLRLGPRELAIERLVAGRRVGRRSIALTRIRGVLLAREPDRADHGRIRLGLRLVLHTGRPLFLPAPDAPEEALEWLASEIRIAAARAAEAASGTVAPELVELLTDPARARIEAERPAGDRRRSRQPRSAHRDAG